MGDEIETVTVTEGNSISIPEANKEGYSISGWHTIIDGGNTIDEKWSFTQDRAHGYLKLKAK